MMRGLGLVIMSLLKPSKQLCQLYDGENKLHFYQIMTFVLFLTNTVC
jgi:hypothetical protein